MGDYEGLNAADPQTRKTFALPAKILRLEHDVTSVFFLGRGA